MTLAAGSEGVNVKRKHRASDDDNPLDDYISVAEAAEILKVGPAKVLKLGRANPPQLTMKRVVGRFRISRTSVDELIKKELGL